MTLHDQYRRQITTLLARLGDHLRAAEARILANPQSPQPGVMCLSVNGT